MGCSRCGSQSHRAAECCKPFLAVSCAYCGKSGHSKASCPKAAFDERQQRRAAFEERRQRRAAGKAAFEERQQTRAERAEAAKSWTATRDTDICSIASTDGLTASTASTVADLPRCSYCGAKRVEPKQKRFANKCANRCQSCWREFQK